MNVRWTYDERVEDGLTTWYGTRRFRQVLEDPEGTGVVVETIAPDAGPAPSARSWTTAHAPRRRLTPIT